MDKTVNFELPQDVVRITGDQNDPWHHINRVGRLSIAGFVDMEFWHPQVKKAWPIPLLLIDSQLAYKPFELRDGLGKQYYTFHRFSADAPFDKNQTFGLGPTTVGVPYDRSQHPSVYLGNDMEPPYVDAYVLPQTIAYNQDAFKDIVDKTKKYS